MRWRSVYAAAFGFRQARVYTMGSGSAFAGHSAKLRPAEPLPSPTHGACLTISLFQRDSGNLREEPTVFLAGRRCEFKHFLFRKNAAPAPAKIQGRVDRAITPVAVLSQCAPSPSSRGRDGIVLENHPPGRTKDGTQDRINPRTGKRHIGWMVGRSMLEF